ncbi:hypothetical protein I317_03311 [Kwoniella heveanensis CBS 569]|nr:hypothetical protein I317_03311 [Kwoniella heveanensis CBS 569]
MRANDVEPARVTSRRYLEELEAHCTSLRRILLRLKEESDDGRREILDSLDVESFGQDEGLDEESPQLVSRSASAANAVASSSQSAPDISKASFRIASDGDNRLSLHGPSSLFYISPSKAVTSPSTLDTSITEVLDLQQQLFMGWIDSLASQVEVPALSNEVWHYLLRLHWTWVQPLFGFVHRKAFLRDMHRTPTQSSLFSPFLLYSLCAHVVRHDDLRLLGDDAASSNPFLRQARLLVTREVERGSSLAAIQGLLLLSSVECAVGRVCQAWVYLMVQDLGIHLDGREGADREHFTAEELANRRHSFWSAYLWDKMVSLYLGRRPALQLSRYSPSANFTDEEAEAELWCPAGNRLDDFPIFMPTPARAASTFANVCRLACIINDILTYDAGETESPRLEQAVQSLATWREELPSTLRIHASAGFQTIPPSHVINLKVHRGPPPNSSINSALEICVLAQLSHKHFRDRQAVLSHCSTTYANRLRVRENNPWLSNEESILVSSLQWCTQRLSEASATIKVLQDQLEALQSILPGAVELWFSTNVAHPGNAARQDPAPPLPTESGLEVLSSSLDQTIHDDRIGPNNQSYDLNAMFSRDLWDWPGGGEMAGIDSLSFEQFGLQ